jgi:hypothetical protein
MLALKITKQKSIDRNRPARERTLKDQKSAVAKKGGFSKSSRRD